MLNPYLMMFFSSVLSCFAIGPRNELAFARNLSTISDAVSYPNRSVFPVSVSMACKYGTAPKYGFFHSCRMSSAMFCIVLSGI